MTNLEGKVVIVTGGSRGIGEAIVHLCAESGALVVYCARHINRTHQTGEAFCVDISQETEVNSFFDMMMSRYGRIDAVINNAAVSQSGLLVSMTTKSWDNLMATNLTGAFLVSRRAIQQMIQQQNGGRIITIGSIAQYGMPMDACYATSKAGLVGLTQAVAYEYGQQCIRANLLAIGYVETTLTAEIPDSLKQATLLWSPQSRSGTAHEIASVVAFLVSDGAAHINGQVIRVSGGLPEVMPYK